MAVEKHFDQLSEFHLRDLSKVKPGVGLVLLHTPTPADEPDYAATMIHPRAQLVTVSSVAEMTFDELHPSVQRFAGDAERSTVISYIDAISGRAGYIYASDAGLKPYDSGVFNDVNFTVLADDLQTAGVILNLTPSEAYAAAVYRFNEQVDALENEDLDNDESDSSW